MSDFETISIKSIKPAEYNPRVMDYNEFGKLLNSIREFGLVDPLIVNLKNMTLIGGHQRYEALLLENEDTGAYEKLKLLRRGDIGWVFTDTNLDIKDANHEKGLNIALNKISGDWDYPKLSYLIDELLDDANFDISLTGFDNLDLQDLDIDLDNIDLGPTLGSDAPFVRENYTLIVDSENNHEIEELYNRLIEEGYDCRIKE